MSFDIKKAIHESNLIEGYDDPSIDAQSLLAWKFLTEQTQLTHYDICKVQKIITILQNDLAPNARGYYRGQAGNNVNVTVGNHVPPVAFMVPHLMENWLIDLENEESRWMHAMFETIHPFVDGNGRTGRMLMWWDQLRRNEEPWVILNKDKQAYYEYLQSCQNKLRGI